MNERYTLYAEKPDIRTQETKMVDEITKVWVPDTRWIHFANPRSCRRVLGNPRRICRQEAHFALLRGNSYWVYCPEHMYGDRINGDVVETQVAVDSPAAKRGYA